MQRRDRIDIIYDMLITIRNNKGRIRPTRLMYKANMSHIQMKNYLQELLQKGFIKKEKVKGHEDLVMTDNGFRFVLKIKEMKEFDNMFGI